MKCSRVTSSKSHRCVFKILISKGSYCECRCFGCLEYGRPYSPSLERSRCEKKIQKRVIVTVFSKFKHVRLQASLADAIKKYKKRYLVLYLPCLRS